MLVKVGGSSAEAGTFVWLNATLDKVGRGKMGAANKTPPGFRAVRSIDVNQEQLDAIADVLDIPQAERQRLRPGRIRIIKEGTYRIEQDDPPGGTSSP